MENKTQQDKFEIKIGDIVINQYKVLKQLGKGGMDSVIYLVEDITEKTPSNSFNNKKYALKIIDRVENTTDEAWRRYYDECVTCTRISQCENVAKTYHVAELVKNKTIMILMEYIDGNSLREVIKKQGSLGVQESLFLFRKILIALQDLHSFNNKIIHRDLKPENILLSRDRSNLKIIDFGISSVVFTSFDKNAKKKLNIFLPMRINYMEPILIFLLHFTWPIAQKQLQKNVLKLLMSNVISFQLELFYMKC